jgi:phosphohistidine phosphatase
MELLLWRHADAEDGHPDSARELTRKGRAQAAAAARWLAPRLPGKYRLLVSPAVRAQQTAQSLGGSMETEPRIDVGRRALHVLEAAGWGEGSGTVIVVGHQPTLGQVAALLLRGKEDDWPVRKSAIWWFRERAGSVELRAVFDPDLA